MITIVDNDKIRCWRVHTSVELTTVKYSYCVNIFVRFFAGFHPVVILSRERVRHNLFQSTMSDGLYNVQARLFFFLLSVGLLESFQ